MASFIFLFLFIFALIIIGKQKDNIKASLTGLATQTLQTVLNDDTGEGDEGPQFETIIVADGSV